MKTIDLNKDTFPIFTSIAIEISSRCNRHCYFCPNDYFDRPDQLMPKEMFDNIVDQLRLLNYAGRIEFYLYNEPTRDKRLADLIKEVRLKVPKSCMMISTNGDYFKKPEDIQKLFDAGLNQMQINIYSNFDRYSSEDKRYVDGVVKAKQRSEYIRALVSEVKGLSDGLSVYQNIGSKKRVCKVVDKFGVARSSKDKDVEGPNTWGNRSGLVESFKPALKEPMNKYCTKPFRFFNINWQGEAMICCNDFNVDVRIGNVKTNSLLELWSSEPMNRYRLFLQNSRRDLKLCEGCDFNGGFYPHMINKVTFGKSKDEKILKKVL